MERQMDGRKDKPNFIGLFQVMLGIQRKIMITAKYITGSMYVEIDRESKQTRDSSKWKLCQVRGMPEMDLFTQKMSHPSICPAKSNLDSDAFQISWARIALPGRVIQRVIHDQCLNAHKNSSMDRTTNVSRTSKHVVKTHCFYYHSMIY